MPVLTASRARPSKNLLGYEPFFQQEMQLDIRTKKATDAGYGTSRMWSLPEAGKEQVSILIHREEASRRWWVHFMPAHMCDADHTRIVQAVSQDFEDCRCQYEPMMQMQADMTEFEASLVLAYVSVETMVAEVVT